METAVSIRKIDEFHSDGNTILVLGIGNYLMGDEGVGVHFINRIDKAQFPEGISFIDGGTGGFTLIPYIESHQKVIIVDATMDGKEEGTISLLKPRFSEDFPISLSGHNFGLKDMVEILSITDTMPEIYLYTITILKMDPMCMQLSPKVEAAIEKVTAEIIQQIEKIKI
ncbi:HyaD/HybD family hydrogenase maturation endopeptidase [Flavobacterium johnsoniae]|uniref:Hydrogenase maturation protease n=1 Tax=Flavobacterium johnsoniae (strain ATCC 17061 / DSM 2064 / JCM 8514 / BCRC 14874 / CCUG 350202 / NBRC 14942 / NCIMB 11054 / UW101) TaxID=376686 RepID=A5FCZ1_FLAJ1|nr:HyaD/HybD family hydrogenase maturation endopeptidase [Flavobacterium johnsoniae]ABQ06920.1 hydrogenase maturation protease [Flavobacterium johnsoniae UW101]OXE97222.1 hydrogenase maturation protease [Flavobacterium johnsoniae UW101]WQG81247.1 HyaD/HybD family hydrogenase maturation endopeptidase [Flavobacterium johnsoniae UW101]SHL36555.1 hydrogenase maturation protease [Flavobacterium johnsoniae]